MSGIYVGRGDADFIELQGRCDEAARLLRAAYSDVHPEDVPMDVLEWLNLAPSVLEDGTHPCADCGEPYFERLGSYWLADYELWVRVVDNDTIVLCPACFTGRARAAGVAVYWRVVLEGS